MCRKHFIPVFGLFFHLVIGAFIYDIFFSTVISNLFIFFSLIFCVLHLVERILSFSGIIKMFLYIFKKFYSLGILHLGLLVMDYLLLMGYDFFHINNKLPQHYLLSSQFFISLFYGVTSANMCTKHSFIYEIIYICLCMFL